MGKDKAMFKIGQMVFAKVRGYPPWPARITSILDDRPQSYKYGVYFFGTAEIGSVFQKDIFSYKENKDNFGKPIKRKLFRQGMEQIEEEIRKIENGEESTVGLSVRIPAAVEKKHGRKSERKTDESQFEDYNYQVAKSRISERDLVIEESKIMPRASRKKSSKQAAEAAQTAPVIQADQCSRTAQAAQGSRTAGSAQAAPKTEQTSRSGRVIRPKKFMDEETVLTGNKARSRRQQEPEPEASTSGGAPAKGTARRAKRNVLNRDMGRIMWARTKCGEMVQIRLDRDRPATFKDDRARMMWERAADIYAARLKAEIESGERLRDDIKIQLRPSEEEEANLTEAELSEMRKLRMTERKRGRLRWLKLETKLVDIDVRIRGCLQRDKVDIEMTLSLMDELLNMPLDPLMLKKHPQVVDTAKKLRQYVGNTKEWNYTEEETRSFELQALKVRQKADGLYKKYTSLFAVPETGDFWSHFLDAVKEFTKLTRDMPKERVYGLIIDPSSPYFKDVSADDSEEE